jgi:hypothetical protein
VRIDSGHTIPIRIEVVKELAIAFWRAGDIDKAVGLLDQALDRFTSSVGTEHPARVDVLSTLGEIMFEQRHLKQACTILREVMDCCVRHSGAWPPNAVWPPLCSIWVTKRKRVSWSGKLLKAPGRISGRLIP